MLKPLLLILTCCLMINTVKGQKGDSTTVYFENNVNGYHTVSTLDSADFFRVILPPDPGDSKYRIREYYKNGKIKLVGKSDPLGEKFKHGFISFSGSCIRYYPNGKRESMSQYFEDHKEGLEYIYYPNDSIYFVVKHSLSHRNFEDEIRYWECYDNSGAKICSAGNGNWVVYDRQYKTVLMSGKVKNGFREGEWDGKILNADSIKYVYMYEKGLVSSSIGYDKTGKAYPFTLINVAANYRGGFPTFINEINKYLKVPKGPDGKKIPLNNIKISFIVEKDSTTSHVETLGVVNQDLDRALAEALSNCHDWTPTRFYGIPYRTRVILPLKYFSESFFNGEAYNIPFDEQVLEN